MGLFGKITTEDKANKTSKMVIPQKVKKKYLLCFNSEYLNPTSIRKATSMPPKTPKESDRAKGRKIRSR
jgi:hypothetical protein